MHKKGTKTVLALAIGVATVALALLLLSRTTLGEKVKQESARVFAYEYIPNQDVAIEATLAAREGDSIYSDFREKYRFHYQTIGLASFADSSRMMLLADLPPHFETDSIASIFAKFAHRWEARKHPIGYDGYTTDLLIVLGNATQENCDRLIQKLNRELYLTDYKPVVMPLPADEERRYFADESLDYQITLEEFDRWFMEEGEGFVRLEDTGTVLTVGELLDRQARGVYFSRLPGFVAWAVAKDADLAPQVGDIRQFTLDADLILGALADSATLVIVGRERQAPLCELPPLQIESILLLAATTEKELSQSLDINDLMAGKMNNGQDWCPTYLSRELENTEFGDLMTITDVLLKDWSEQGTIRERYYRYPEPRYYPFDRPLFRKLGLNELVYNWNTAGAMYAIDRDGYTLYTLGRTGSLPVSYFNSQERSQSIGYRYENQAYHYFATLGNTDLARVVQYTALYQLFVDNNIRYSGNTYPAFPKNKPFLLYKPTTELLDRIRTLDAEQTTQLADSLARRSFENYLKEQVDKQLRENEKTHNMVYSEEQIAHIYKDVHRNTQAGLSRSFNEVKQLLNSLSEEQTKQLARYLSYPRGVKVHDRESYNTYLRGRRVNQLMREMGKNNLDLLGMDLREVKNWYAASLKGSAGRYLKTSSLIVTYNDLLTTGGHNLSSRISRVNSMSHYKRNRNYTPTDYEKPPESGPVTEAERPQGANPDAGAPTAHKRQSGASTGKKTGQGKTAKTATTARPRSAVISSAQRTRRGL